MIFEAVVFFVFLHAFISSRVATYMAVVVQQVVGEFEFIERDDLFHPLGAFGRRVRVIVDPARCGGVGFTGNQPRRAVESVPVRSETRH